MRPSIWSWATPSARSAERQGVAPLGEQGGGDPRNKELLRGSRENYHFQLTREQVVTEMLEGRTFQQVSTGAGMPVKRAMAYRLVRAVRTKGSIVLFFRLQGAAVIPLLDAQETAVA